MAVSTAFRYADLFAGIGGFHAMLDHAGGHCVYVSEIDHEARETYTRNWVDPLPAGQRPVINTDINLATPEDGPVDVPEHDVLAAGFPCQPFSKSGYQRGMDEARGTLFWNIARILEERKPAVVLLENVRNIAGPRHRHEWDVIIQTLREIGYRVSATPSVFSPHFLPPWRGGTPQVRDRVFILGTYVGPRRALSETDVPPTVVRGPVDGWNVHDWDVDWILDDDSSIPCRDRYALTVDETDWTDVWDELVQRMWAARGVRLPGFPLWADAWVPERSWDPFVLETLPRWKSDILIKNARFYDEHRDIIHQWLKSNKHFDSFPPSRRKLEWQAQDTPSLWDTVMHFRPSGIRAKAPTYLPALVAITQTSVIGSRRRRITPHEAARLQGLPRSFSFEGQRDQASYKQVGNGVAVGAAWHVFRTHVERDASDLPPRLLSAVLRASLNPTRDALTESALGPEAAHSLAIAEFAAS
ncbi:DNA cytosine methyltransferase [Ornithinimicrobium cerasi]|uniref:DNA cytosine methyltransferase n=1 Tax=Ornithinimicrobium cerasi TaxID=2248773 RepID=UPI000BE39BA1|nr:DNA cytosine methyltransferase [Ornithinimicrobium cerasi]